VALHAFFLTDAIIYFKQNKILSQFKMRGGPTNRSMSGNKFAAARLAEAKRQANQAAKLNAKAAENAALALVAASNATKKTPSIRNTYNAAAGLLGLK
jgi:hypothetical protein